MGNERENENVDGDGQLARHLDDHIACLCFALLSPSSSSNSFELLRYQLRLSHDSLVSLHKQIQQLRREFNSLHLLHRKAKEEAALNAAALKRKVEENEKLKERCEQLRTECALYHRDREVFLEAADDAEERRAEAELHAAEAERSALNAQRRLEKAICFFKLNFKDLPFPEELAHALSAEDEHDSCRHTSSDQTPSSSPSPSSSLPHSPLPPKPRQGSPHIGTPNKEDVSKRYLFVSESKRPLRLSPNRRTVLADINHHCNPESGEFAATIKHSPPFEVYKDCDQNSLSPERKTKGSMIHDASTRPLGKENLQFPDPIEVKNFRQAAKSDVERLKLEIGHLMSVLKNGQNYLSKAEVEAELIKAKNWELQALFKDKFSSLGTSSLDLSERGSSDGGPSINTNTTKWLGVPKVADSIINRFRKDKVAKMER